MFMRVIVLDLDGSLPSQAAVATWIETGRAALVDLHDLASKLRIVASRAALASFSERVRAARARAGRGPDVILFGSGDFHHLTPAWLRHLDVSVTVIHFDNHPDWVRIPPTSCAAWVNRALELTHVVRVVTIGPCSADLQWPELKTANLDAMRSGRLEVYPWRQPPTRLWGSAVDSPCVQTRGRRLVWRNIVDEEWTGFVTEIAGRIPTEAVWITIDKDVLSPDEAITNWDQGEMRLDQVLGAVATIAEGHRVVGVDVCGDYSLPQFRDPYRAALARFDRPFAPKPKLDPAPVNGSTNQRIVAALQDILA
jgi:hypothetical protein